MNSQSYEKPLTANDTGETGGHQAGVHIPKSQTDLLRLLPWLDPAQKNPDAWLEMTDDSGIVWKFRYIYYNNKLHDRAGTRDEYRITHMTGYFRAAGATAGDVLVLTGSAGSLSYSIRIRKDNDEAGKPIRVLLRGWRRVH